MEASFKAPKGHPVDYYVPNFGLDADILVAQKNIADQEKKHGKWSPKQDDNGVWLVPQPIDNKSYSYAAVQLEDQINLESDPICSSAGCPENNKKASKEHPKDYFVPNFGDKSRGIRSVDDSLSWAEGALKHKWNYVVPSKKGKEPVQWKTDTPLDEDISSSIAHLKT